MQDQYALICDSGTGYVKIGLSNENFPKYIIPALVGRPLLRYDQKIDDVELKEVMVGDEAAKYRVMLELNHPIEEGIVKDWDDTLLLWKYSFEKMNINPTETTILMTEPIMNPQKNRIKMAEVLFEQFGFPRMQIAIQALLSLYAEGLFSGILVDSGDGVTHCIPVVDGNVQKNYVGRMNIAGRHLTNYLIKLLFMRGYAFNSSADFELVREIKEKYCFTSCDLMLERKLASETTFHEKEVRLPDNTCIKIGRERFEAPELLFNPFLGGHDFPGISEMVFNSINKCPIDTRRKLYESIIISGGTSMFPGFPTRMQNDITNLYRQLLQKGKKDAEIKIKIQIVDTPRRKYNVFIGGGIIANLAMNNKDSTYWITKKEYQECGGEYCMKKIQETMQC